MQKGKYPIKGLQEKTVATETGKEIFTSNVANVPLSRHETAKFQSAKTKVTVQADEQQKKFSSIWKQ